MIRAFCAALCALTLTGCGLMDRVPERTPPEQDIPVAWRSLTTDGHALRRIVVLPLVDAVHQPEQTRMIEDALVASLRKRHLFEVISVRQSRLIEEQELDIFQSGVFRKKTLIAMAERHRADGVLFGVVTHYRAYEPPLLGLKVDLVSVGAGDVVWSANGIFDGADQRTEMDVHNYHDVQLASSTNLDGWRRMLASPRRFVGYVCDRMVATF